MKVECSYKDIVDIANLKPHPKNPNKHNPKQIKLLAKIMKHQGWRNPIVVSNQSGFIVAGHGRLEAAQMNGWKQAPVDYQDFANEGDEYAHMVADNKIAELADFDMKAMIRDLETIDIPDLDMLGIPDFIMNKKGKTDDNYVPSNVPKISDLGQMWQLGEHRLFCGDCTKIENVLKLMAGEKADLVFTDPPYNVNYSGRGENTSNTIQNDNLDEQAFRNFLTDTFKNYVNVMKKEAPLYTCYASRTHREFEDALNVSELEVKNQIIWVKIVASMGWGDYRWKHEPILYCHIKDSSIPFYGDRKQYTTWDQEMTDEELLKMVKNQIKKEEDGQSTVWRFNREYNYSHPTQKPVELITRAIANSSKPGELIVDFFGGSGSTMIACEKMKRKCYMMELDEKYASVIIKRWEEYTGQKAHKIED